MLSPSALSNTLLLRLLFTGWLIVVAAVAGTAAQPDPAVVAAPDDRVIDLAGAWRFKLGGESQFPQSAEVPDIGFADTIELPGTTETRGKGPLNSAVELGQLTRVRKYDGPAWYQRTIEVPARWQGKRLVLAIERTKYAQVWFDGKARGEQRWASVAQEYVLTDSASPGRHILTVMVDNRPERRPYQAESHQYSDNTQTNWNGLLGTLELRAEEVFALDDLQVIPDAQTGALRVELKVRNGLTEALPVRVEAESHSWNHEGPSHEQPESGSEYVVAPGGSSLGYTHIVGMDFRRWDEFSPALYRVKIRVIAAGVSMERTLDVGFRELRNLGGKLLVNGRVTFLRGKHDACVFPLTGHPPMEVEGWLAYFKKLQRYGINHVRCHTWVPPRAAFVAADRLGIYLQPELAFWGTFDEKIREALQPEAERVVREYGNHPSFVMMTLGNEIGGDRALMNALVARLKTIDARHLYADGSNNVLWDPQYQPGNDFWITARAKTPSTGEKSVPARGSYYFGDGYDGHVQWGPSNTRADLRAATEKIPAPVIGHEIGQYTVYPNFREISKYTGVVEARNLEYFRNVLKRRGLLSRAHDWFRASGVLAASLYKEEIELALRTPGFGGFQLLDLQDFPGQGTALVGILDSFLDSKGLITEEEWFRFCAPVVPLARFDRYTWTTSEVFEADLQVAQYGQGTLLDTIALWKLVNESGEVVARGENRIGKVERGAVRDLGKLRFALNSLPAPARYDLELTVASGSERHLNTWPLWLYPEKIALEAPEGAEVVQEWALARQLLREGRKVLFLPKGAVSGYSVRGAYATDFWCWPMFSSSPGTMGFFIESEHPALERFPTRFHSERQWAEIAHASRPLILTDTPAELSPIVHVIDNLARNEKLGLIFEARVGDGKLLVCAVDLLGLAENPAARQLLASLQTYVGSESFDPETAVEESILNDVLRSSLAEAKPISASSFQQPPWGAVPKPESAVDGDINTRWTAKDGDNEPWISVDLGSIVSVDTVQLLWDSDESGYRYVIETSSDGANWVLISDQRENTVSVGRHTLKLKEVNARHVRVKVSNTPAGKKPSLRDLRIL